MIPSAGPRSARVGRAVAVGVVIALGIAVALVLAFPGGTGLTGVWPIAQVVAFRAVVVLGLAALAVLLALLPGRARPARLALVGIVVLAVALQVGALASRGYADSASDATAAGDLAGPAAPDDLVVLAANTAAGATATDLAILVSSVHADVVVLPETTRQVADDVAAQLATSGTPMQVLVRSTSTSPHSSTALLVAARLGTYRIDAVPAHGPGMFTAVPVDGVGPTLVAVHTTAPTTRPSMAFWRQTAGWATTTCRRTDDAVVAGDFNATLDHPAFDDLAPCVDAGEAAGAAALGSWPSSVPRWLAAPIDHVLVDGRSWRVRSFAVLDVLPGSDHRPVVAHLSAG
ncbi:MAG: endonuclease/exonuclease/phosphatase family protein [Cellulomonas sp.]